MATEPPINKCLVAYWDNQRFGNSLIDAPERMQAVFDVLAEWCDQLCYSDTAQRLRDPQRSCSEASQRASVNVDG
jgi:hypothetical protein